MLSTFPKSKSSPLKRLEIVLKAIFAAWLPPWMSEQAACKGKGHQSQREFVHIQRGKPLQKCQKYENGNA